MIILEQHEWEHRAAAHQEALEGYARRYLARRTRGHSHPTEDFLWQYFGIRPGRLLQWGPGVNVALKGDASRFVGRKGFERCREGLWIPPGAMPPPRIDSARWILHLLEATRDRSPVYGCLGLHEWAMVYEEGDIRHAQLPLRLSHKETRAVLEAHPVCCTHFDAFRFFSESARPLNRVSLCAGGRPAQEQPACLHANMDLLKWQMKLTPWIESDGIAELFAFALEAREVDMRASPYDVRELDLDPICIENPEGRRQYTEEQRRIADRAAPLRDRLIQKIRALLETVEPMETVGG